ncbi:MAG: hypothetical protein ABIJ48_03935 [Actinomycetota bacterium]
MPRSGRPLLRNRGARALDALHRQPLTWAALLSVVVMAVLLLTLTPLYETNDDVAMQAVVDGTLTGEPLPHVILSNVILGLILRSLYRALGWFPWYGAYLYLLHLAALVALVYVVLSGHRERLGLRLLMLGGVVAVFHIPMWMSLQFTSTAFLLGATGVVLFRSVADRVSAPWVPIVAAGAMVGISWWVRWRSAAGVLLLAVPILAPALRRTNWRRFVAFAGVVLVFVVAGAAFQAAYYGGQPEWQEYFTFNAVRGQLHQTNALLEVDSTVLSQVGWSDNDLHMFDNWFFTDAGVFETADLEAIAAAAPDPFRAAAAASRLRAQAQGWPGGLRVALTAILGGLLWLNGGRRLRIVVVSATLVFGAAAFYLAATAKLPPRVALPMLAFLAVSFLGGICRDPRAMPDPTTDHVRPAWWWAAVIVSAGALTVGGLDAAASRERNEAHQVRIGRQLAALDAVDPAGAFVAWAGEVTRWDSPLSPWTRSGPHLIPLGWMQRSPAADAVLTRYGIGDLYTAIALREDVYLPLRRTGRGTLYLTYLREHYGFSGLLKPAAKVGPVTVFSGVAAYEVDAAAGAVVESRLDGSIVLHHFNVPGPSGTAVATLDEQGRLAIKGRTDADLVVVMEGDHAIALGLPTPAEDRLLRFKVTLEHSPEHLRLFALSGGLAGEITLRAAAP